MVFEPTHYLSAFEILMWIADLIEAAVVQRLKQRIPECFALTNLTQASQGLRQYDVYLNYHSLNLTPLAQAATKTTTPCCYHLYADTFT